MDESSETISRPDSNKGEGGVNERVGRLETFSVGLIVSAILVWDSANTARIGQFCKNPQKNGQNGPRRFGG